MRPAPAPPAGVLPAWPCLQALAGDACRLTLSVVPNARRKWVDIRAPAATVAAWLALQVRQVPAP